jgi:iron complex transport system substrate-binding protein
LESGYYNCGDFQTGIRKLKKEMTMNKLSLKFLASVLIGLVFIGTCQSFAPQSAGMVKDLAGRQIIIPKQVNKVSGLDPLLTYMLWRLAPQKLISIDKQFKSQLSFMTDEEIRKLSTLPVTGVFYDGSIDREQMLLLKPDVILSYKKDPDIEKKQDDYSVPVVAASKDSLEELEASWRLIGNVVGNEKEGNELADYWHKTMAKIISKVAKIPKRDRVKVYYAQQDVNSTVGPKTIMVSIIRTAGGVSLYDTLAGTMIQQESENIPTSMEQILVWNPDVVITGASKSRDIIMSDPRWQNVSAVKNKRVYASLSFERLDNIQSLMGLVWVASKLYPERVKVDFTKETRNFYSKMYHHDGLTEAQIYEEKN